MHAMRSFSHSLARLTYNVKMNVYANLKESIKQLRVAEKLTQAELSEKLNIPRANLGRYETGENIPPLDILIKIADYFDVSLDEILGRKRFE
jgi:transcriptional regulator with XRE-family HTH domain